MAKLPHIGFLGPTGTYSSLALQQVVQDYVPVPIRTINGLFESFFDENSDLDKIFVPIENSVNGNVGESLDGLFANRNKPFVVEQEAYMGIETSLMAKHNVALHEVTDIISHPQPLAQSNHFLRKHCPNAQSILVESTGEGARLIASDNELEALVSADKKKQGIQPVFAAIGDKRLADKYELTVLATKINDYQNNTTRWFLIGKQPLSKTGKDKTSFVFSIKKDEPGGLYKIIKEFADRGINLTKITSRPIKDLVGEYVFFIDFEGHIDDNVVADCMEHVKQKTSLFKCFGSFPVSG